MAVDLRKLRPSDLLRVVNSTAELGSVCTRKSLDRLRDRFGFRIGDGQTVDAYKFAGELLLWEPEHKSGPVDYEETRRREAERRRKATRAGQDIGEIPKVKNPKRRAKCEASFLAFLVTYFPAIFYLALSAAHLRVIGTIQNVVEHGWFLALAMPRGFGKTTISELAALWAVLTRRHKFVVLIGAESSHASQMLENIQRYLREPLLAEDFPEFCYPIECLEGINQRRLRYRDQVVEMGFTADQIRLPGLIRKKNGKIEVGFSPVLHAVGLRGRIRGLKVGAERPTFVIPDDPQTDESARSVSQCDERERLLFGAVMGLAGPGRKISGIMPCTAIREDDLTERCLDRQRHPELKGERVKLLAKFPERMDLWEKFNTLRREALVEERDPVEALDFYREYREAMDAGADVTWPERFEPGQISGLQFAMELYFDNPETFAAEYQNEPFRETSGEVEILTAAKIAGKVNRLDRGVVPAGCDVLTAFVDVQQKCLWWMVCAWKLDGFSGGIIDYGAWPAQKATRYTLSDIRNTLERKYPGRGVEGAIFQGLTDLSEWLLPREFLREDGVAMRCNLMLVDANWQTATVRQFTRRSKFGAVVMPSHGRFIGPTSKPLEEYRRVARERSGHKWRLSIIENQRHLLTDVNYWKSFLHQRLTIPTGAPGCLELFGDQSQHWMVAAHLTAEKPTTVEANGRAVEEWKLHPSRPDNHLLDCGVGCAAGASYLGCQLPEFKAKGSRKRRRLRVSY